MASSAISEIATERLRLRDFAVRDARPLQEVLARPGVGDWFYKTTGESLATLWGRGMSSWGRLSRRYTVTKRGDDRLIGHIRLGADGRLTFVIDPQHWGRGLATEAVGAVIAQAEPLGSDNPIKAAVFDANEGSRRVLEKLGFAPVKHTFMQPLGRSTMAPATVYARPRSA
ncbi:MAG: GNAT family N-acetyltransferase [Pseudomonadota bacterium]